MVHWKVFNFPMGHSDVKTETLFDGNKSWGNDISSEFAIVKCNQLSTKTTDFNYN